MGLMQRRKGKRFERAIAAELRLHWADAIVRRASQAERADNPDVFIEGGPPVLARLWLELQDSRNPTPAGKLDQAENDVIAHEGRRECRGSRMPVVVWHRLAERTIWVTTRLGTLLDLTMPADRAHVGIETVTLDLKGFIAILKRVPS